MYTPCYAYDQQSNIASAVEPEMQSASSVGAPLRSRMARGSQPPLLLLFHDEAPSLLPRQTHTAVRFFRPGSVGKI